MLTLNMTRVFSSTILILAAIIVLIRPSQPAITKFVAQSVNISCSSGNSSVPLDAKTISWKHQGRKLMIDDVRITKPSIHVLGINNLRYSDSGEYVCFHENTTFATTKLVIQGKPVFTKTFAPQTKLEGEKLNITCAAYGVPMPSITWEKDNRPLTTAGNRWALNAVQSSIVIASTSYLHNGTYKCIAANKIGVAQHAASVQVYVRANINKPPKKEYVARNGANLTLSCGALGNPIPTLFWHKDSANFSGSGRFHFKKLISGFTIERKMTITSIKKEDSGDYVCLTINSFSDLKRATARVIVQGPPLCCKVTASNVGSRSVKIMWELNSDEDSPHTKYNIQLKELSSLKTRTVMLSAEANATKIDLLTPNTAYEFNLTAENSFGSSLGSLIRVKTLAESYQLCLKLQMKVVAANLAVVQWDRNCSTNLSTSWHYVDVIVTKANSLVQKATYKRLQDNRTALISSLSPYTEYQVKVRTIAEGTTVGFESGLFTFSTLQAAPSPPRDLKIVAKSMSSIELTWNPPMELNGVIALYVVKYYQMNSPALGNFTWIRAVSNPKRKVVLGNLIPNTVYIISVRERTGPNLWSEAVEITERTTEGVPTKAPQNLSASLKNKSSVILKWNHLSSNDVVSDLLGYSVIVTDMRSVKVFNETLLSNQSQIEVSTLKPNLLYDLKVSGCTKTGCGKESSLRFFTADVPSAPRSLQITTIRSRSVKLRWMEPAVTNGIISSSQIQVTKIKSISGRIRRSLLKSQSTTVEIPTAAIAVEKMREYILKNLHPFAVYSFRVRERTVKGWGMFTENITATTKEGTSSLPGNLTVSSKESSWISFYWTFPREPNGRIKVFTVQCLQLSKLKRQFNVSAATSQATCHTLESNTESVIKVFAVSSVRGMVATLTTKTAEQPDGFPWIPLIGGCVGFVFVIAILVTTMLLCKKRTRYEEVNETMDEIELNGTVKSRPIHISNLKQYVVHNHTNSDHGFFTEYESIKPAPANLTWEHSQEPCNQHKNRYSNIVAYDHTRVILSPVDSQAGSTYINANYVDGYKHPRKFIATQGPLPETVSDFWRMIYEQNSHVIIMLTRIIEGNRVKCEQYWPDDGSLQYGEIIVTVVDSTELSDYVVRTFSINSTYDMDCPGQEVKQYHYLGWPDHGVPEYPTSMVTFTKNVMDSVPPKPGPIVVHCSAGVGRTGTLIVIDAMLNQIRDESIIDVYWFISHIRKQRNFLVQTESQYVFIYDGLLDAVICGNTEVFAKDVSKKCRYLNQQSPDTGDTFLRQEFRRLEAGLSSQEKELFSVANLSENKEKNRFVNILPFNRNRVKLAYIYGIKGSDYINASYVDGYIQRHSYIATQAPLETTVNDFWRMIWEQNCHNIIMLTKLKEKGQERSYEYWPSCGSECFGKFLIDNLSETEDETANTRRQELNLTYSETGRSRRVNHYMFTGWPDYGSPTCGRDIIKLVSMVQDLTSIRGCGPIVIHCSGGAGRTGTFIALCVCTQKLKANGSVDVFQTVRQLRTQRPAMVQTIDQYYFIYQALKDYVDSTDAFPEHLQLDEAMETLA